MESEGEERRSKSKQEVVQEDESRLKSLSKSRHKFLEDLENKTYSKN